MSSSLGDLLVGVLFLHHICRDTGMSLNGEIMQKHRYVVTKNSSLRRLQDEQMIDKRVFFLPASALDLWPAFFPNGVFIHLDVGEQPCCQTRVKIQIRTCLINKKGAVKKNIQCWRVQSGVMVLSAAHSGLWQLTVIQSFAFVEGLYKPMEKNREKTRSGFTFLCIQLYVSLHTEPRRVKISLHVSKKEHGFKLRP